MPMELPRYSYCVTYLREDHEYIATCLEIPGLSGIGPTEGDALRELKVALEAWLDYLRSEGFAVPEANAVTVSVRGGIQLASTSLVTGETAVGAGAQAPAFTFCSQAIPATRSTAAA